MDARPGDITDVVGTQWPGFSGDGGLATRAHLSFVRGGVVDDAGNIYLADTENQRVRKVDATTGVITTVAGTGRPGFSGDGGPATDARLNDPTGVALDGIGNLYIADQINHRVRKVDAATGVISTVAGTGQRGFSGDGGLATQAELAEPLRIAVDAFGNLYIVDLQNSRIRLVNPSGTIRTVAGDGTLGFSGDGGPATLAQLLAPADVAVDAAGDFYIADQFNHRIRKVDRSGIISTVAGSGPSQLGPLEAFGDGRPAVSAALNRPTGVCVDRDGNLYIADRLNHLIRKVDAQTGIISTVAGSGNPDFPGLGSGAREASIRNPTGVFVNAVNRVYILDTGNRLVRSIDSSGNLVTVVGTIGDGGEASLARLLIPRALFITPPGDIYVADTGNMRIRKVDSSGIITTVAGNGIRGDSGDGDLAIRASIQRVQSIAVDSLDNLYIADRDNHRIRMVDAKTGVMVTLAGTGEEGYGGDGGLATDAILNQPRGLFVDREGSVWIADSNNHRIRKVDGRTGMISTVIGIGEAGFLGDDGPGLSARINVPEVVFVDSSGSVYIGDQLNRRIRKVDGLSGRIQTLAGDGFAEFFGDGDFAWNASIRDVRGLFVDADGSVFIGDEDNNVVRAIQGSTGIIFSIAGTGIRGYTGDVGPATDARLNDPKGVFVDAKGDLYIADEDNHLIRRVEGVATPTVLKVGVYRGPTKPNLSVA